MRKNFEYYVGKRDEYRQLTEQQPAPGQAQQPGLWQRMKSAWGTLRGKSDQEITALVQKEQPVDPKHKNLVNILMQKGIIAQPGQPAQPNAQPAPGQPVQQPAPVQQAAPGQPVQQTSWHIPQGRITFIEYIQNHRTM